MEPRNVSQLFPSQYVTAEDLKGKSHMLTVDVVEVVQMRSKFTNQQEYKGVVRFVEASKGLVLNKTQALAFARIAGSEEFDRWPGLKVILRPGRAPNGKQTILVDAPAEA